MMKRVKPSLFGVCAALCCVRTSVAWRPTTITVVDLRSESDAAITLAAVAAAGLANRNTSAVITLVADGVDDVWLDSLLPNTTLVPMNATAWLSTALATHGALLFDDTDMAPYTYTNTSAQLPSVVTLASVLDAVPLAARLLPAFPGTRVVFDAVGAWATPADAVAYTATHALANTTSLAFQDPAALGASYLSDFVTARRIFTLYLNYSCVPLTDDNALFKSIMDVAPWNAPSSTPVRVYGYNGMIQVFGGDLYEAETDCWPTLGQVATQTVNNMPFWSHIDRFTEGERLAQPTAATGIAYNASKVYVALVYGDMDNVAFVFGFGRQHMATRAQRCANTTCFPLTWTLSPNLIDLAPAVMRWYYAQAATTGGQDTFIMPPSGTLYSYPGQMSAATQANYVQQQNAQAAIMSTTGSVHWEWVLTWQAAWDNYFPRYVNTSGTRSFFLNDVPWVIPILDMLNETYRIVGDPADPSTAVVGFKPAFNWQLDGPSGGLPYNASVIAGMINAFTPGTVTYVYVIQNTDVNAVFDMAAQVNENVQLVGYHDLTSLAFQRTAMCTAACAGADVVPATCSCHSA